MSQIKNIFLGILAELGYIAAIFIVGFLLCVGLFYLF